MLGTIAAGYGTGLAMEKNTGSRKKLWFAIALAAQIGVLAYFKYFDFFAENINLLFPTTGTGKAIELKNLVLPLGLSFHTFQAISYTIEVYRGNQRAERHPGLYAAYIMFFPQLVAGPIERPQHLLRQMHEEKKTDFHQLLAGLKLMCWGLFKKAVIADRLGLVVDAVFKKPERYSGPFLCVAVVFYAFQIYCDFSGYTDIAIGAAQTMGFRLSQNFNHPFKSTSVTEFWRRWHISLSTWLRDYIFLPLSVQLRNWYSAGIAISVMVTFAISGLWHGAAWKFVIWGLLHGAAIAVEFATSKLREQYFGVPKANFQRIAGRIYTFGFLCVTWVFFRAESIKEAMYVLNHMVRGWGSLLSAGYLLNTFFHLGYNNSLFGVYNLILGVLLVAFLSFVQRKSITETDDPEGWILKRSWPVYFGCMVFIVVAGAFSTPEFIYFNF